jgi:hypothetical protein
MSMVLNVAIFEAVTFYGPDLLQPDELVTLTEYIPSSAKLPHSVSMKEKPPNLFQT